jgi:hypothetical protein
MQIKPTGWFIAAETSRRRGVIGNFWWHSWHVPGVTEYLDILVRFKHDLACE